LGLQARRQSLGGPRSDDTAAWRQLEPRDVMRRLHVSDPQVVLAARVELERRGISGPLVDLARRATDPDPNVRKQFAESLPSMPGIDAKPWLLELSYDENSQVRATAVGLMATSGDLELIRRLEQISRDDPDDYIRAQAAKGVK
jgi:HEAT repeat protein